MSSCFRIWWLLPNVENLDGVLCASLRVCFLRSRFHWCSPHLISWIVPMCVTSTHHDLHPLKILFGRGANHISICLLSSWTTWTVEQHWMRHWQPRSSVWTLRLQSSGPDVPTASAAGYADPILPSAASTVEWWIQGMNSEAFIADCSIGERN
jgi:hypothetical protein